LGTPLVAPSDPVKTDDLLFEYTFSGWNLASEIITSSVDVYPCFSRTFKQNLVHLNSGIDTIKIGDNFVDAGITVPDASLVVQTEGTVDSLMTGKYTVWYQILYENEVVAVYQRIVHVQATSEPITIVLNPGVSTLFLGETYVEAGATANGGTVTISGTVDSTTPGIYRITYQVEYDGEITSKTRYVFVVEQVEPLVVLAGFVARKEEEWNA